MTNTFDVDKVREHWGRERLAETILEALAAAGKDLDRMSVDELAATDQFHGGDKPATQRLAGLAAFSPGTRVLDVCGGLGGPARTLAVEFGCRVTVVDLTPSYVRAASVLTRRLGLQDRVRHLVGNALELPFADGTFDAVWTQNSGMPYPLRNRECRSSSFMPRVEAARSPRW
jgi:predicted O-methyltransferase YrrM